MITQTQLDELRHNYEPEFIPELGKRLKPLPIKSEDGDFCWTVDDSERKRCGLYNNAQELSSRGQSTGGFSCNCCGNGAEFRCLYLDAYLNSNMAINDSWVPEIALFSET